MTIRAQSLEEWFTAYQLRAIAARAFHLPIDLEIDVTRITRAFAAQGRRAPLTAVVIKAAALLAAKHPEVNRAVLHTPIGARVVQFDQAHVNVPVAIDHDGKRLLTGLVIRQADSLSVDAIVTRLREARHRKLDELPIARRLARGGNNVLQRAALRATHFLAYSVPPFYASRGGGISVSSLLRPATEGVITRMPSYGPTAFSLCPGVLREQRGKSILYMGIGYDHVALPGYDAVRCADALGALLTQGELAHFGPTDATLARRDDRASSATTETRPGA
jgi:hypothetical protein